MNSFQQLKGVRQRAPEWWLALATWWLATPPGASAPRLIIGGTPAAESTQVRLVGEEFYAPIAGELPRLGATARYDAESKVVRIVSFHGRVTVFPVGAHKVSIDGVDHHLPEPVTIESGVAQLPLAAVAQAVDAVCQYDESTSTVSLRSSVVDVRLERRDGALELVIKTGKPTAFSVHRLESPERVYVDLPGVVWRDVPGPVPGPGDSAVTALRMGQTVDDPPLARVVADLRERTDYTVLTPPPAAVVRIRLGAASATSPAAPAIPQPEPATAAAPAGDSPPKTSPPPETAVEATEPEQPEAVAPPPPPAELRDVVVEDYSSRLTRITLKFDGQREFRTSVRRNPARIVLDFANARAGAMAAERIYDHRLLGSVASYDLAEPRGVARVNITLTQFTSFLVRRTEPTVVEVDLVTAPLSDRVIVVDAGHGGKDPGAMPSEQLVEKEINLDIAKRVYKKLLDSGVNALMTRADDTYVSLQDRCSFANNSRANLFVSIHCNSYNRRNARQGTEVYYWNENSYPLAVVLHDALVKRIRLADGGVRQRMFYVVHHTNMPAALVEVGYLNHWKDARKLASADFRELAAQAIVQGLKDYSEGPKRRAPSVTTSTVTGP